MLLPLQANDTVAFWLTNGFSTRDVDKSLLPKGGPGAAPFTTETRLFFLELCGGGSSFRITRRNSEELTGVEYFSNPSTEKVRESLELWETISKFPYGPVLKINPVDRTEMVTCCRLSPRGPFTSPVKKYWADSGKYKMLSNIMDPVILKQANPVLVGDKIFSGTHPI
jgi:hypothetical protein